jgi:hypothetical protein
LDELCNKLQIDNIPDVGLKYFLIKWCVDACMQNHCPLFAISKVGLNQLNGHATE